MILYPALSKFVNHVACDVKYMDGGDEDAKYTYEALSRGVQVREKLGVIEERQGVIEFWVVNNDNEPESMQILTELKKIFMAQLPKMPREYIARLVYDRNHLSLAIVKREGRFMSVKGGITYRPFNHRTFAEIVFCAISSTEQVQGYGVHLMNHLKDYVKATTTQIAHFLTYADNYAIGYFKKQGFTKEISLEKSLWMSYIKDYEGGTLMQCTMVPRVKYLDVGRMLATQKVAVKIKIAENSKSHIIYPGLTINHGQQIDPMQVPGLKESGWTPEMDEMAGRPKRGPNHALLAHLLNGLQSHSSAWPFLQPVNRDEVADYYDVIKEPMDFSTMESKLDSDQYISPEEIIKDAKRIFSNCRSYNNDTTTYWKHATKLEKFMMQKIRELPEISHLSEF